jgi:hypothetical protein
MINPRISRLFKRFFLLCINLNKHSMLYLRGKKVYICGSKEV